MYFASVPCFLSPLMPLSPADLDDYRALTTGVGLIDLTSLRSRVELTGDDRRKFLHNFCTNDVNNLADGAGCEAFLLDAKGHVLFYVFIYARPERLLVECSADRGESLVKHLDKYLIREKVKITDLSATWSELLIAGPLSSEMTRIALSTNAPSLPQASVAGPGDTVIVRSIWTPNVNFCVLGPTAAVDEVRNKLLDADPQPCGTAAFESLRIEAGLPLDGIDVSDKNLAQEVDRNDRTLHFRKGCYLGQETVARLDALGHVNKRLVGLKFSATDDANPPQAGATLAVGTITSAAFSPRLDAWLALAYIRENSTAPGTKIDTPFGPAEVAALPFV